MKDNPRQQFRWQPHTSGVTMVKPKDYEPGSTVESLTAYSTWMELRDSEEALRVGDLLEAESGELRIYKYVGFEEARWVLPEVKSGLETLPAAAGQPSDSHPANAAH